jgi:hypothetical protein
MSATQAANDRLVTHLKGSNNMMEKNVVRNVVLAGAIAILAACGGGGGGGDPEAEITFSPNNGATDVSIEVAPTVYVNNTVIDCDTVSTTNYTLGSDGGAVVNGSLDCFDDHVIFTPDAALAFSTKYVASVASMKNQTGAVLCDNCTWTFTTAAAPTFAVTHVLPASGATNIGIDTKITATFSGPVDCSTVNAYTFKLNGATAMGGTVSACSGSTATFTPTALLANSTSYTASLAATVRGTNGVTLGSLQSWSFTTSAVSKVYVQTPLNANAARWVEAAGADATGNVMLLYKQKLTDGTYMVTAERYKKTLNTPWMDGWWFMRDLWTHASSAPAKIAVSKNGNAVVLAKSDTNALNFSYYNAADDTWSGASVGSSVASLGGAVTDFQPAIDDNGNAMVVWSETPAGTDQVYARYYNATTKTLGTAQALGNQLWPHFLRPRFAFAPNGNGTVVFKEWQFMQYGGEVYGIGTSDYDAATDTWSAVTQITSSSTEKPVDPEIAIDAEGNTVVVWIKQQLWDDPNTPFYYAMVDGTYRYAGAQDWTPAHVGVGWDPKGDASDPHVVMLPNGNALATWTYTRRGETAAQLNAAYLDPKNPGYTSDWFYSGESTAVTDSDHYLGYRVLGSDSNGGVSSPSLVVDKNGKATLVYSRSDGTRSNVYLRTFSMAARVDGASGWSDSVQIDTTDENASGPIVAADGTGASMAIWNQWNPTYSGSPYTAPMNDFFFLRK